jgi:pimeloyl-ACP methyl ester carboxylesterase
LTIITYIRKNSKVNWRSFGGHQQFMARMPNRAAGRKTDAAEAGQGYLSRGEARMARYRTIALSLRHCWPEHWDGEGDDFTVQQHTADIAGFISALDAGLAHLLGHSRGGHIALRVAHNHPDLFGR